MAFESEDIYCRWIRYSSGTKGYPNVFGLISKLKASIFVLFIRLILTLKKPNRCTRKLEKKKKKKKEMKRVTSNRQNPGIENERQIIFGKFLEREK